MGFKNKVRTIDSHYFRVINQLQKILFSCYIKRDYFDKRNFYEEKIHNIRIKLFSLMKKMRATTHAQLSQYEDLYEIIFSFNTLKLHVTDLATFEVCENDFKQLTQAIEYVLVKAAAIHPENAIPEAIAQFTSAITEFEELYRGTLQVVSQEPIVFLFFIQNLLALRDALQTITLELTHA